MKNVIVAISREFGSGGRKIGFMLAEQLGFKFYDRAVIEIASEKAGMSPELMEDIESSVASSFLFNLSQATLAQNNPAIAYDLTPNGETFLTMSEVVKEIASRENAVIIGCCADYILRDEPGLISVFLHGEKEDKLRRLINVYGISEKEAKEKMRHVDRGRESYYRTFTESDWGSPLRTDLYINTSRTGLEGAVAAIKALVLEKNK